VPSRKNREGIVREDFIAEHKASSTIGAYLRAAIEAAVDREARRRTCLVTVQGSAGVICGFTKQCAHRPRIRSIRAILA
jgi:hypothetical protein